MRGAEGLVNALKAEGVEFVAGFPGGGMVDVIDALIDVPEITSILTRHERVAVDIADGYARASGKPGVAIVSQGAGGAHAFAGLAQAYSDNSPVLAILGHVPRRSIGNQEVQEIQNLEVFRSVTKWVARINMIQRVPEMMRRAFTCLRSGRPQPVALELPADVGAEEVPDEELAYLPVGPGWRSAGDPADVEAAAVALIEAKLPVIYAGAGVLYADGAQELMELAELLQAPVMSTLNSKSVFPEDHPLSLGLGGYPKSRFGTKPALCFAQRADVVLAIGNSFKSMATMRLPRPEGVTLIHVNVDEQEINKNYQADLAILGDAKLVLSQLTEAVKSLEGGKGREKNEELQREIRAVREDWLSEWMPRLTSDEVPINPYRVTWDIMHGVDRRKTILLHDSGYPRPHSCHHYQALFPGGFMGMGGQSAMGWSLGAAMGAKLAHPDKMVVNVMGDGAFGMTGIDLETAVRHAIPILCVVVNNSSLGITAEGQKRRHMVDLSGDYSRVATGLGALAERVEAPAEIIPALKRARKELDEGRPALLEIIVKPEGMPGY